MTVIKLSLHNHTTNSDGHYKPEKLLQILAKEYDVVAITDHNYYTRPKRIPEGMLYIGGVEFMFPNRMEILSLEFNGKYPKMKNAEVAWICHPRFLQIPITHMAKWILHNDNIYGYESWNQGMGQISEQQFETIKDYGFIQYAVDDMHVLCNLKTSWMEMEVDSFDKHTVLENLKSGDFEIKHK